MIKAALGGLPRTFWVLVIATLVDRAGAFILPFLALYLTSQRALSVEDTGVIVACFGAGSMFSGPVGGALADRYGRRLVLVGGTLLSAASMLHLAAARSEAHIAVAVALLGFCASLARPALSAAIADVVPAEDRQRAYGLLHWAVNIGFAIAPSIAGLLAHSGYGLLFILDAATTTLCALLLFFFVPETGAVADRRPFRVRSMIEPLGDGAFFALLVAALLLGIVFQQVGVVLPVDLQARGIEPLRYGLLIALNGLLIALIQPFAPRVVSRFSATHALCVGALLTGAGFALTAFVSSTLGIAVSIAVWTLGELVVSPVGPAVAAAIAPADRRASYQGALQLSWAASALVAPLVGPRVLAAYGSTSVWVSCGGLGVVAAAIYLALGPALRRR